MVMPRLGVRNIIASWPDDSRLTAQDIINKYGEPYEATPSMLIWYNNGPWKKTVVYRDTVKHNFPVPHTDAVEQFVNHEAPMEKACELAAFNGSLVIHCTRGEISSCCRDESLNFLTINLAHDIIMDKKTFERARSDYAESFVKYRRQEPVPYMEKLQFVPEENTADPDERAVPSPEEVSEQPAGRPASRQVG
jgi:hypothetical protein